MTYVILRPGSNSNPGGKHLVVEFDEWMDYTSGREPSLRSIEWGTAAEAQECADELNRKELKRKADK